VERWLTQAQDELQDAVEVRLCAGTTWLSKLGWPGRLRSCTKERRALLKRGVTVPCEGRFLVKGRYTDDFGDVYLHGGLSLVECLAPCLVVQRVRRSRYA
jgi:hypothetical protein